MFVIGIDPGSRRVGYAVLKKGSRELIEAGVINIEKGKFKEKIISLKNGLENIFERYDISEVAIEDIFFAYNPKSVIKLAQFRGVILLWIIEKVGDFFEYTPLQIKRAITGKAKATKQQVAFMVKKILAIEVNQKYEDVTDAIAIALTHLQRKRKNEMH